jgi:hypothetical protein
MNWNGPIEADGGKSGMTTQAGHGSNQWLAATRSPAEIERMDGHATRWWPTIMVIEKARGTAGMTKMNNGVTCGAAGKVTPGHPDAPRQERPQHHGADTSHHHRYNASAACPLTKTMLTTP